MPRFSFGKRSDVEKKGATTSLAAPDDFTWSVFGILPSGAGIVVTPEIAMTCTPFGAGVRVITEVVGLMPVHLHKKNADGTRVRIIDHPASRLLQFDANEFTTAQELRQQVQQDAILFGNGLALITRSSDGVPLELIRLFPPSVVIQQGPQGEPIYTISLANGGKRVVHFADMIHIKSPSVRGFVGDSIPYKCREAIGLSLALEKHGNKLFANGARPSGILSFAKALSADGAKRMKASWQAAHSGDAAGGTAILEDDGKFLPLTFSSVDAQFLEMRRFCIEEMGRALGVPNHLLGELGRATFNNTQTLNLQFLQFGLMPHFERWQGQARKLFTVEERNDLYIEFVVDDLLRADIETRFRAYRNGIESRIYSPNEVRAMENKEPYAGGDTYENPNTSSTPAANDNAPAKEPAA